MARSLDELKDIITRGESVLLADGRVVIRVEDLPSAIELAGNDIVKRQQALGDLEAARKELDKQIADAKTADGKPADDAPKK